MPKYNVRAYVKEVVRKERYVTIEAPTRLAAENMAEVRFRGDDYRPEDGWLEYDYNRELFADAEEAPPPPIDTTEEL